MKEVALLIDREKELAELNLLLEEPGAHLLAVSGRRRLGKTTLLLEWARRSGRPYHLAPGASG
jgi:AAA+ ATPase superfamily predicted ATPase